MTSRQLANVEGGYYATLATTRNAENSLTIVRAIPQSVYTASPAAYIETVLPQIANARVWLEWCERMLIEDGLESGIPQRKLADLSSRPTSTVTRWKVSPLMGPAAVYGPKADEPEGPQSNTLE